MKYMVDENVDVDNIIASIEDTEISDNLRRKIAYLEDRKRTLGTEYYSSKEFWDRMWENEWDALEERTKINVEEIDKNETISVEMPTVEFEDDVLKLYSFEDFNLLHNQGIFRETKFLIDKRGKWTKNIVKEMKKYGYEYVKTIIISREKYLIMKVIDNG